MPIMTETESRLRETLTAVASSVLDLDEATPDDTGASLPIATPPTRRQSRTARRRPVLAFGAAFISVLIFGSVSLLAGEINGNLSGASMSSQVDEAPVDSVVSGIGMDGSHFAIDDQDWILAEAWEISEGGPGTYSIYRHGSEQTTVLTGSATSHSSAISSSDAETTLTINSNEVTERIFAAAEEVAFEWTTSEGVTVVVTFFGMGRDRALQVSGSLRPIDSDAWDQLLQAARARVDARTGEFGSGGEAGAGELIRLDAPDAPDVILELAEEIELPPGHSFDRLIQNLPKEPTEQTEQGIRSMLEFEAGCIWTGYWLDAVNAGDTDARDRALAVLEEVPTWPALNVSDGGRVVDAWVRNVDLAAAGDVQGVLNNLYTANCTNAVPGR